MHDSDATPPDGRLSRLLARWAAAHRLDARQADAVRQRVLATAAPPDFEWWWRLLDPEHGQALRGLGVSPGWRHLAEPSPPILAPGSWSSATWQTDVAGPVGWSHEDGDYLPYLRLT